MARDIILLGLGAIFGLGTALVAMAAPLYYPNAPAWTWHWMFWAGIVLMVLMIVDAGFLLAFSRAIQAGPAILGNAAITALAAAIIWQAQPRLVVPLPIGEPKNFGTLSAPKVLLDTRNNKVGKVFRIGDKGFIQLMSPDKPAFDFGDTFLDVETIDDELKVSTTLKDESGTQIALMYRNEWKVMPPPKTFDRNYTKDALEIMGPDGSIVLQLKLFPDYVFINGQWHTADGRFIRIVKGLISVWQAGQEPKDLPKIQPMFLYPSESFFGQVR